MDAALIPSSNEIEIDCFLFCDHFVSLCNKCMRIEFFKIMFFEKNRLNFDINTFIFDILSKMH